ncbi:MAG: HAD-IA family hydrolase [Nostocaceae cyanobacterium]|nr:HAD-IA family hydrolase [Nostocaceae cyanobacterium]
MTAKVIIFDFDGTIADTFDAIVSIINSLAVDFGYKPVTEEEIAVLRNYNTRQIIKYSGVSIFQLFFLFKKVKAELSNQIQNLSPIEGVKEALIDLKNQGNTLGIMTSNSKGNVMAFLEKNGLEDLFDFIYTGITIFGKSTIINNLLKQEHLHHEAVIYVGDETRDIEAAKKSHIKVIAVGWGFNSQEVLAAQHPDFLVHHPWELVYVIKTC